jgi:Tol biopolymer transport system component
MFSPDGRRVAFLSPPSPEVLGGTLLVVSIDDPASPIDVSHGIEVLASRVSQVTWSPDGNHIAFAGLQGGVSTIFVAASNGTGVAAITDNSLDRDLPSWSPDGEWIAYRAVEPDGLRRHLEMVRPDGSEVQQVTTVIAADANLSRLDWSPINDSLVYAMNVGFGTQSAVMIDLRAGHTVEPWTDGVGGNFDAGVRFSPDGRLLAILTAADGLVVADYDPTSPDYEGELRRLGPAADCWIDWSPDGTALYGGSPDGCENVVVIPLADPEAAVTLPMSGVASWQPGNR